jgi:hypothetical protein
MMVIQNAVDIKPTVGRVSQFSPPLQIHSPAEGAAFWKD